MKEVTHKHLIKYLLLLAVAFLLVLAFRTSCVPQHLPDRDFNQIQEEGVLRVVTEYSTTGYYISDDSVSGFQYTMANALAGHFGWKIEISLENNLAACIEGLNTQQYDVIARNIPINAENKKILDFTDPILFDRQVLIQRTASINHKTPPIRNQIELGKKTVFVPENSPAILRLQNLSEEIADTIYVVEDKQYGAEQLIYMVVSGDIDYAVIDRNTALSYQKRFPGLDMQTDIGFTQMQSWAVRKTSPALLDSINSWLKTFEKKD